MSNYTLNQNQFTQTPAIGQLTFDPQPDTLPCQLNQSSTNPSAGFVAGAGVKLISYANSGQVIVDTCLSASDGPIFGVIEFSKQKNSYVPGDQINVAAKGNTIFLKAASAIVRGSRVAVTNPAVSTDDPTIATDTTPSDYTLGFALGQQGAGGSLIRVMIDPGLNGSSVVTVSP